VLWSIDSKDYERPGAEQIADRVVAAARPGAIVLMHDGGGDRTQTIAAIPKIVRGLRAKHYRLVTVPQLLRDDPPPVAPQPPQVPIDER
jgi:peptidoglycan/xylan/chitin deacetylase (PgdA/CDA1 family)